MLNPEQPKLFFWNNQNLFSNNYLDDRLPTTSLWKEQEGIIGEVFDAVKKAYGETKTLKLGPGEEAGLEDKFIRPVLKALGYEWDPQPTTKGRITKKRPDYALFKDKSSLEEARKDRNNATKFFKHPLTILEAKYWGRRLNDADPEDTLDKRDPTAQTVKYLDDVYHASDGRIQWAILTNGKLWRLFYYKAASRSGNFFEIDLEEMITQDDRAKFLYFYLFFARDAFIPDPVTGRTWLDQHLKGTEEYAVRVSTKLKELIFDKVFEGLAEGFVHYRMSELSIAKETEVGRKDIFKGCLTLLYRMLFLLYAESRNLLPVEEDGYGKVSLSKLRKDIDNDIKSSGLDKMSKRSYVYWARLEGLSDIIANGDSTLNVPVYNGGLFETPKDSFLSVHKMPDPFLAEAIKLLTVDHGGEYIDYSSLSVRHLGDIYEGLLEFHVQIADEEMVEIKEKGKSIWKRAAEVKKDDKIVSRKQTGEVCIENSKHERKATGSYYTPHYIVEYIVKNTVGAVLDQKLKTASELLLEYESATKALLRQKSTSGIQAYRAKIREVEDKIFDSVFGISVLDPAMGSGHFLVHTVDFISDRIIAFLAGYPENPVIRKIHELRDEILVEIKRQGVRIDESKLTEVNLIKRMVMKRCIYGVDLNDMAVELAKLSLWLDSFTLGAPLSFLDHHLKCGNSLIGVFDIADVVIPNSEAYSKVHRALSFMLQVSELTDATITEAKKSYDLYNHVREEINPIRRKFDVVTAKYFMDLGTSLSRVQQLAYTMEFEKESYPETIEKCKTALQIAEEKRFFHWKLEFPEVFYTIKGEQENPGFDCVIGNPPYDVLSELEQGKEVEADKKFFEHQFMYKSAVGSKLNLYRLFGALSLYLLKNEGTHGFIVPMALLADKQAKPLREFILKNNYIKAIEAFPQKDDPTNRIFIDAKLSTCVYIINKQGIPVFSVRIHTGKDIDESATLLQLNSLLIKEFDSDNLSIPSYPNMTTRDLMLALKLNKVSKNIKLKQFALSQQGEVNLTEHSVFMSDKDKGQLILRGAHINRYEFQEEPKQGEPVYLDVERFIDAHGKDTKAYDHKYIRIGYQRGSAIDNWRRIIATIIEKNNYCSDTINYIVNPKEYNLFAILALLNSSLWEWRFRLTSTNNHVNSYEIDSMSMPPISFTTPQKERKKRVDEAIRLFHQELGHIAINDDKWQNKNEAKKDDKDRDKRGSGTSRKVAKGTRRYKLSAKGVSGEDSGLGGEVHGVREGAGKYGPPEGASGEGADSTRPLDSTRYFETAQGIKTYSEVAEILAVSVAKSIEAIVDGVPEEIHITSEWICKIHDDIAGSLFPKWAGRFRDINVQVGSHIPPPYYEVPVHVRLYCEDLAVRLASAGDSKDIEKHSETLAYADWRFQWIHPFKDFNGRVGRIVLSAVLFELKLPPGDTAAGDPERRERYLKALHEADAGDLSYLNEIWMERLTNAMKRSKEK